jgi:homoserine O-acetyltransferase
MEKPLGNTVGYVKLQYFTFAESPDEMILESGEKLGPITLAYETYGTLNNEKTNALLILHALSGNAHAAGFLEGEQKAGWWDLMVGPGKAMDTNKYFVICSNVIGSCYGSTGPTSIDPSTNKQYGINFPVVTVSDMVKAQKKLLDHLGISQLVTVIGGSMGGMQALEWTLQFPDVPKSAVIIASCAALSDQEIAFDVVGRDAIKMDSEWKGGEYYGSEKKLKGLAVARMIGHITYLSEEGMAQKFGRRLQSGDKNYSYKIMYEKTLQGDTDSTQLVSDFEREFAVESYLSYQGEKFVSRFDANSYLYITKAMDYYDAAAKYGGGSLAKAMKRTKAEMLLISFSSDMLFSPDQSKAMVEALRVNNKDVSYIEIASKHGHDAFLLEKKTMNENKILTTAIKNFLLHSRV